VLTGPPVEVDKAIEGKAEDEGEAGVGVGTFEVVEGEVEVEEVEVEVEEVEVEEVEEVEVVVVEGVVVEDHSTGLE